MDLTFDMQKGYMFGFGTYAGDEPESALKISSAT